MVISGPRLVVPHRMAALFLGNAAMNAAMAVASAVATIVTAERLGGAWGAVPNTAAIVGTGLGAWFLAQVMVVRGRRRGLVYGYATAFGGTVLAVAAMIRYEDSPYQDVTVLTGGMVLLGLGNAAAQLSRYAGADLYPAHRRGIAISLVVWGGALGAVGGPLLLVPSVEMARRFGWTAYAGPYGLAAVAVIAALLMTAAAPQRTVVTASPPMPLRELVRSGPTRAAFAVMATAQVVMVTLMTAAPLQMHLHGDDLGTVGTALSVHTLGMFVLSPLTGWLVSCVGTRRIMLGGLLTMAIAAALPMMVPGDSTVFVTGLFLLGYGWNACFVGGSAALATEFDTADRAGIEGGVDAAVWTTAAAASLTSTMLLSAGGYALLAVIAGVCVAPAALIVLGSRRQSPRRTRPIRAPSPPPRKKAMSRR